MHNEMRELRCAIIRGGTSKGIFFKRNELPADPALRDKVILAVFGSPDVRQIDGLGGADVLTSKLAIVSRSTSPNADIDYTFGQVSFVKPFIDYKGNCGNISAAVGPYAIDEGMVPAIEPVTTVRIRQTNSNTVLVAEVPVKNGKAQVEGGFAIDGVPGTGAKIVLDWSGTVGGQTGKLLPTGNAKDILRAKGSDYEVSLIDAGNPHVFIAAGDLGLKGTETPAEIEENVALMDTIEAIRSEAAVVFGLAGSAEEATAQSPYAPFFAVVSGPADYIAINGNVIKERECHMVSRLLFMQRMHKAYPITGTVATGAAARVPGSVIWDVISEKARENGTLLIGHPSGIVPVEADAGDDGSIERIGVYRTARRIMDGKVYVKNTVFEG